MDFKEFMAAKYPDIEPSGIVYLAIKAAWNACKEEAAKVADEFADLTKIVGPPEKEADRIAKAIREQL